MHSEIEERARGGLHGPSRWAMAGLAFVLVIMSFVVLELEAEADAECERSGEWFCGGNEAVAFAFVAVPAWIIAGLLILGAVLERGIFRRLVVGLGVGLFTGLSLFWGSVLAVALLALLPPGIAGLGVDVPDILPDILADILGLAVIGGFCLPFYLAYLAFRLTK